MKCQKCNQLFVIKGMRYCSKCSSSMTLEQKIQAQREYKEKIQARLENARKEALA